MRRIAIFLLLLLVGCGSTPAPESAESLRRLAAERLPKLEGSVRIAGLEAPVEILRDQHGVAHIYAQNQRDLFFAQGYVAAQDRMYQIEIWRRTGAGELAEVFGPEYVDRDRIARLVRYRGDMDAEWASYGAAIEGDRHILHGRHQRLGRTEPRPAADRVRAARLRAGNLEARGRRAAHRRSADGSQHQPGARPLRNDRRRRPRADRQVLSHRSARPLQPDPDLDLAGLDARVTAAYRKAVSIPELQQAEGSNNWVVAGRLSATGAPLLASDPHRPVILPSLRYLVHLNAPGWNVIGSGEPALPGVAIGHNERIGWGFTIVQYDLADLFIERLNPEDAGQYSVGAGFQPFEVERDHDPNVRGGEPVEVELQFSRHGPVIWTDPAGGRVAALRWAGQEPGTAGYLGSLALDQAQDWDGFVEAMKAWKVPSENMVYADVDGHIGWIPAGLVPIRRGWRGLLPVPGWKDDYRWDGFRTIDQLPRVADPEQGYVATANHNVRPAGYPHDMGFDWANPYRFQRIDEVLGGGGKFSIEDFKKLQHDETSLPARALVAMLAELPEGSAAEPRALLSEWDFVLDKDSAAAALFQIWMRKLPGKYVMSQAPPAAQPLVERNLTTPQLIEGLRRISEPERRLVMQVTLDEAWSEARQKLGERPSAWRWGALHRIELRHPLANTAARREVFNLGPFERGGDANTPNATSGPGFEQASGASYRHILDLADWDRSVFTSTPGQSGMPGAAHYDDLAPRWAAHEYLPLPFSRAAVEAATKHRLMLEPAP
jgi:penicillin G amidase